jgi:putative restriction endonuclease
VQIAAREGQPKFRSKLLLAYGKRCAISGCDVEEVLEAAHIVPHSESPTDDERNGILLRADLHTLLDKGLLGIKPSTRTVELHPDLRKTSYREFEGRTIQKTNPADRRPDLKVLKRQYAWFRAMQPQ